MASNRNPKTKKLTKSTVAMRIIALICYGLLASWSGFFLWMLWQIRSKGTLTVVEPNAAILNVEIAMAGLVLLVAIAMFARERLSP